VLCECASDPVLRQMLIEIAVDEAVVMWPQHVQINSRVFPICGLHVKSFLLFKSTDFVKCVR
jgi:hypothetical protein